MERLQNLRFQSYNQESVQPHLDNIAPVNSRPQQRMRISEEGVTDGPQLTAPEEMEEGPMEEMLDAFLEKQEGVFEEHEQQDHQARHDSRSNYEPKEEVMRKLARLPLYNGANISVLRASLTMLNLQSIFGWSDASVTELFK